MKVKVSIKDIAKAAGVSPGAVSFILNGRGDEMRISRETQERVRLLAEKMNYQPNMAARRLRLNRHSDEMSIMFSWVMDQNVTTYSSTYLMTLMMTMAELDRRAKNDNSKINFSLNPFLKNDFARLLAGNDLKFHNAILLGGISDKDFAEIETMKLPVPLVVLFRESLVHHSIFSDSYGIGYRVAEMFSKKNFNSAGLIYSDVEMLLRKKRKQGFIDGCNDFGIELRDENIIKCGYSYQCGGEATAHLLEHRNLPDGIFYLNNVLAVGSLDIFSAANIRIPEDTQIITFDDTDSLKYFKPSISVVDVPINDLVDASLEVLGAVLQGNTAGEIIRREIPARFIFRDSFPGD